LTEDADGGAAEAAEAEGGAFEERFGWAEHVLDKELEMVSIVERVVASS
jgi:hypothetical protein